MRVAFLTDYLGTLAGTEASRPRSDMARVADPSGMIGKQSLDLRDSDSV